MEKVKVGNIEFVTDRLIIRTPEEKKRKMSMIFSF